MNVLHPCPPPRLFRKLLDGLLPADEEAQLTDHLDRCPPCQLVVERLSQTLHEEFRLNLALAGAPLDTPLRAAMHGLKAALSLTTAERTLGEGTPQVAMGEPAYEGWLGPYEVKGIIGRGGMGVVLKAFDPSLHRLVAIKVLAPHLADNPLARRRFAREGRAAAAVRHENVIAVHAVNEADGLPYLVMEYVPGISLQDRLDRDGPLDVPAIVLIGIQIASGLAAAHAQGLIHRDIKPANIMLGYRPSAIGDPPENVTRASDPVWPIAESRQPIAVKITDFGLARAVDDASLTQSGAITGTPQYMAPEQARGEAVDHRADLFSLGSVLYAMCTGIPPFRADSPLAVLNRICTEEPTPITEINPDIPEWLCLFISILHAKERSRRFASASEAARVLSQYLAHLEHPAARTSPPRLAVRSRPRRGAMLASAGMLILAACLMQPIFQAVRPLIGLGTPAPHTVPAKGFSPVHVRGELPHPSAVFTAAFAPDGALLATACGDHAVRLWDPRTLQVVRTLEGHRESVWSVAFAPDGRTLASSGGEWFRPTDSGELRLWDLASGRTMRALAGSAGLFFSVAFSPDGRTLAAASWDQTVHLWDPATGDQVAVLRGHKAPVRYIAFSPDGRLLASAGFDGCVKLWDATTRACVASLRSPNCKINAVAFSPEGKLLAAAESPLDGPNPIVGRVKLWDLTTYEERDVLHGHQARILSVRFAPDGRTLVAGGGEFDLFGEVLLWDTATWGEAIRLPGYRHWVECVTFSPDSGLLVTTGGTQHSGGEVKLWE
jgi:serine/threonine protein kinase/glucose/arabinose dehydrogenase